MISDQNLAGWLCIIRLNNEEERVTLVPRSVQEALVAKGWYTVEEAVDWEGCRRSEITDAGAAVTDLAAPEWGIDPIAVEDSA